jgi:hypothetical protein
MLTKLHILVRGAFVALGAFAVCIGVATRSDAGSGNARPAPAVAGAAKQAMIPGDVQLALMIKTTLIAFNQANITGNYSVLRDMASPVFQQMNSSAQLAEVFQNERGKHVDISAILLLRPELLRQPVIDERGYLHIEGFFPSKPELVYFLLTFQNVGQTWRLATIGVKTSPPVPPVAARTNSQPTAARVSANTVLTPNDIVRTSWPESPHQWPYWTASDVMHGATAMNWSGQPKAAAR